MTDELEFETVDILEDIQRLKQHYLNPAEYKKLKYDMKYSIFISEELALGIVKFLFKKNKMKYSIMETVYKMEKCVCIRLPTMSLHNSFEITFRLSSFSNFLRSLDQLHFGFRIIPTIGRKLISVLDNFLDKS
jgi:hypothetical protein